MRFSFSFDSYIPFFSSNFLYFFSYILHILFCFVQDFLLLALPLRFSPIFFDLYTPLFIPHFLLLGSVLSIFLNSYITRLLISCFFIFPANFFSFPRPFSSFPYILPHFFYLYMADFYRAVLFHFIQVFRSFHFLFLFLFVCGCFFIMLKLFFISIFIRSSYTVFPSLFYRQFPAFLLIHTSCFFTPCFSSPCITFYHYGNNIVQVIALFICFCS